MKHFVAHQMQNNFLSKGDVHVQPLKIIIILD